MQDPGCLSGSKFTSGRVLPTAPGLDRGVQFLTTLAAVMKSAEEADQEDTVDQDVWTQCSHRRVLIQVLSISSCPGLKG
ncbi:hypothetical protein DPEC_G00348980 [Dallia pectoralis]|uniref:Uncharacterized protein n=1 Tax=Dallia pectoralis TaxID=75939 RepID=A0ACC2F196_DALPE|nr:hypothetical protein DPEC_G00348980 [Dallia pectoralis]